MRVETKRTLSSGFVGVGEVAARSSPLYLSLPFVLRIKTNFIK